MWKWCVFLKGSHSLYVAYRQNHAILNGSHALFTETERYAGTQNMIIFSFTDNLCMITWDKLGLDSALWHFFEIWPFNIWVKNKSSFAKWIGSFSSALQLVFLSHILHLSLPSAPSHLGGLMSALIYFIDHDDGTSNKENRPHQYKHIQGRPTSVLGQVSLKQLKQLDLLRSTLFPSFFHF